MGTAPKDDVFGDRTARHVPLPIRSSGERGRWPRNSQEPAIAEDAGPLTPAWERPATWSELRDEDEGREDRPLPGMTSSQPAEPETHPHRRVPVYSLDEAKYLLAQHRRAKNLSN